MSISAVSGYSATSTSYASSNAKRKNDDPMTQAISQLQTTDPTLASKLTDMQKKVESMKKAGASEKDIQSTVKSTMDGLSSTEKSELKSAMPTPPAGGPSGGGGHHHRAKASSDSDSSTSTGTDSDGAATFSASSLLDSATSTQNDTIMSLLASRAASSASTSSEASYSTM